MGASQIASRPAADDPNRSYLDGCELHGQGDDAELPLLDQPPQGAAAHEGSASGSLGASVWMPAAASLPTTVFGFGDGTGSVRPPTTSCSIRSCQHFATMFGSGETARVSWGW